MTMEVKPRMSIALEVNRMRHSGVMNEKVFELERYLLTLGIGESEIDAVTRMLPPDWIDAIVEECESGDFMLEQTRANAKQFQSDAATLQAKIEEAIELRDKTRCEAAYMKEKACAVAERHKKDLQKERDAKNEKAKEAQDLERRKDKIQNEIKREVIEMERLQKMLKKTTK